MQVSVEATGNLERRMKVEVPEENIAQAVEERLKRMTQSVKLKGFRPGKVPLRVVKQRYAGQVRQEVVGELVQSSFYEALGKEQLRPAGMPEIDAQPSEPGAGLEYTATFEVYPEVKPAALDGVAMEKPTAAVQDADVDEMLENIRRQHRTWEPVERAAEEGDRVVIDFTGTVEGEPFSGNEGQQVPVEIGAGRMIDGFEEGLKGATPGEERALDLQFPEGYHAEELAGKPVHFAVTVHGVEASRLPELDADFVKQLGVQDGTVEGLRAEVRGNMERELEQTLRARVKQAVMDKLLEINDIELPQVMVKTEAQHLAEQMAQNFAAQGGRREDMNLDPEMFREQAERRVALGLLIAEIVRNNEIRADADQVRAAVERIAEPYEQSDEVVKWYYGDRRRLGEVESMVLEEQVVEWVLGQATVTEKPIPFKELMYPSQGA